MSSGAGTLGKYQIIREIARSNDIVYEAYDPAMNRRVALKELAVPHGASEKQRHERLARFEREAKAAGSLAHPSIVTIYEVGQDNGRVFIAMEYLEGQTLRQRIDAEGALPQDEAVRILLEVLDGLAYAHDKGVVHRDIKPDNMQLLPDKRVKITDFGIARLMFEPSLTVDGQIFGTPSYMSPEQVVGRDVDLRTDIWSAGVVLYEAIAGVKPFAGDSVVSISHSIMHRDPPDPPHASYSISRVIRRATDKAPGERYPSAKAMAKELREAMESLHEQPAVAATPTTYAPYNPYAPPVSGGQSVYGHKASGQAYGQPYGFSNPTGGVPPPMVLPPGWIAPPPRKPLLSPASSAFFRRTFAVVLIGGSLVALGFYGVAQLTEAADKKNNAGYQTLLSERALADAEAMRKQAVAATSDRGSLFAASAAAAQRAFESAPSEDWKRRARRAGAMALIGEANEQVNAGLLDDAEFSAQRAIAFADFSGDAGLANSARELQARISGLR